MQGKVLTFDEATGMGAIVGDDGARYLFAAPDVRSPLPLKSGQRVDFVATEDRQAREVLVLESTVAFPPSGGGGHFDLGNVIQRTFTAIGQNAAVLFGAAVILVGVPSTLMVFGQRSLMTASTSSGEGFLLMAAGWVLYMVGIFMLQGMVVKAAVTGFSGRPTAFGDAFDAGVRVILPLLGLAIVAGLGTLLGYVFLIVPGVILSVLWSVAAPSVVVEKRGVFESLQRSRNLTRGYRWQVFGLLVIYVVLSWVIGLAIGFLGVASGGVFGSPGPSLWVNMVSGPVVNILSSVIASAGVASLYYELRTAKEGVGSQELASVFD